MSTGTGLGYNAYISLGRPRLPRSDCLTGRIETLVSSTATFREAFTGTVAEQLDAVAERLAAVERGADGNATTNHEVWQRSNWRNRVRIRLCKDMNQ
jgi:hypothetical protein